MSHYTSLGVSKQTTNRARQLVRFSSAAGKEKEEEKEEEEVVVVMVVVMAG